MGIYVSLKTLERTSPLSLALARIDYCYESMRFFSRNKIFLPETAKIWLHAPTETLGGQLQHSIEIRDIYQSFEELRSWVKERFYQKELFYSMIVFEGVWDYEEFKLAGFFSVNNDFIWRKAYHDVEIDAYGRGQTEDLVDIFWKKHEIQTVSNAFFNELKNAAKGRKIKPKEIYFSIGSPEYGEVVNLIALHLEDWRDFLLFLYSKLRKDKAPWVKNRVSPMDKSFFLGALREQKITATLFKRIQEAFLVETVGKSVTYVAKERESFNDFYQKFKEEVFKTASQELPEASTLKKIIKRGLEKTAVLDSFSI